MVRCNATKLELKPPMKVHCVFNVALLKRYHRKCLLPNLISVDDNVEYEVELISSIVGIPVIISFIKMEGVQPRRGHMSP